LMFLSVPSNECHQATAPESKGTSGYTVVNSRSMAETELSVLSDSTSSGLKLPSIVGGATAACATKELQKLETLCFMSQAAGSIHSVLHQHECESQEQGDDCFHTCRDLLFAFGLTG
jgi:hypothetical protein